MRVPAKMPPVAPLEAVPSNANVQRALCDTLRRITSPSDEERAAYAREDENVVRKPKKA